MSTGLRLAKDEMKMEGEAKSEESTNSSLMEAEGKFNGFPSIRDGVKIADASVHNEFVGASEPLDDESGEYPSATRCRVGQSQVLVDCIATAVQPIGDLAELMAAIDGEIEAASPASALASFRSMWMMGRGVPVDEAERDELAEAAASNDVIVVGQLVGPRDVNEVVCTNLPDAIVRRPKSCVLLEVSVGAGACEVSRSLLEFHGARPTRHTLKMAISIGNVELIRLLWARLPGEQHSRCDLLEVAAHFHRDEPLRWLFRDSTVFDQELFLAFALEEHLADGLLEVLREGVHPWWQGTRDAAATCREAGEMEFAEPPEGFLADGGWWKGASGGVWAITAQPNGEWTRAMTESKVGTVDEVVGVVLPSGVSSISGEAFNGYGAIRSLTIQPGCLEIGDGTMKFGTCWGSMAGSISLVNVTIPGTCTSIGQGAFWGCSGLLHVRIPSSVTSIGALAFRGCSSLTQLAIPSGVTSIGHQSFRGCSGLTQVTIASSVTNIGLCAFDACSNLRRLTIPANVADIGEWAFSGVTLEFLTLVGSPLSPAVAEAMAPALAPDAKVISPALTGR
jgi:hypothetical protein